MDILNFISWIKRGDYRATLPVDTNNLIAVGTTDPTRDDTYRPIAVNAEPLQSLYDTNTTTQTGNFGSNVIIDAHNGVITTQAASILPGDYDTFTVLNKYVTADSKVFLTALYNDQGYPLLSLVDVSDGEFTIKVVNVHTTDTLDAAMRIHFLIVK